MKRRWLARHVAALMIGTTVVAAAAAPASAAAPTTITTISSGWTVPWGMDWLPDGRALITERNSFRVYTLSPDGTRTLVGTVPDAATTGGEGGLLGVAVAPDFASTRQVFFFHSSATDNRIVRARLDGTSLSRFMPVLTGIARARVHNGGRIAFGPDGYLYATTGDATNTALAQNRNSLNGKILRMRRDGTPAPGNPFGTLVYSLGHRNPQGIAWDSAGRLWEAEFGQNRFDELNLVKPGLNYGWPTCEGTCNVAGMTNPKRQWTTGEASPSAIAIADDVVYMAALRGQRLWSVPLSGENTRTPVAYYVNQYGRLRTVVTVPGGRALWLSTTNSDANGGQPAGSDRVFQVALG